MNVTFSVDIVGALNIVTDRYGVAASSEDAFNLDLDGTPLLLFDTTLTVGPSSEESVSISRTLTTTVSLDYGTIYQINSRADSEKSGSSMTPEPSAALSPCWASRLR